MRTATDVAGVCRDIVTKTAMNIKGKKYVKVEGWQSIAAAYGCLASSRDVEVVDGGVRAIGEVRRMSDGAVLATAEGFVGDDEEMWASRPMFARRAMAQTRATSRACRSAFAFVVVMIDANLSTTPAEEMEGIVEQSVPPPVVVKAQLSARTTTEAVREKLKAQLGTSSVQVVPVQDEEPPPNMDDPDEPRQQEEDNSPILTFTKAKGQRLSQIDVGLLGWLLKKAQADMLDPAKEKYRAKSQAWLLAVQDEVARRSR
jgi:hypothetical protein